MPPNVGHTTSFGADSDWDPNYKVQAVYNQSHVWSEEAYKFNEITVNKLKNVISDYEEQTHAENKRFNTIMTEVLHKLEIDLEDSEPERKAQQDQAAHEPSEPREVQLD